MPNSPIYLALDTADLPRAKRLADDLRPHIGGLKLGLQFFTAHGPDGVRALQAYDLPIFLDLKLFDIPHQVGLAVRAAAALGVRYLTVHASGGEAMLREAQTAALQAGGAQPLQLLGVTVLTSFNAERLAATGIDDPIPDHALRLARLARAAGLPGLVCSAHEIAPLRREFGAAVTLMVPGIRPADADRDDQARVMTPRQALDAGADLLVVGRPITAAPAPLAAARALHQTLAPA